MTRDLQLSEKQTEAWNLLFDKTTTELFFGGGAGGGKSRLIALYATVMCMTFKGVRGLLGRKRLKRLKETTLKTLWEVFRDFKLKPNIHYNYDAQNGVITFRNGSEIILADLAYQPSDPDYDDLGSLELTFVCVDEAPQITFKCWSVLNSRLRYKIDEYNLIPKALATGNPTNKWPKSEFYLPNKAGKLPKERAFIQALQSENPFNSKYYRKQLERIRDKSTRERLLEGNWEYNDDPSMLFEYEDIQDLFTNTVEGDEIYISGDVSRKGRDKMPIGVWQGLKLIRVYVIPLEIRKSTRKSADFIMNIARKHKVRFSHIILDEDGIGGGVLDNIPQAKGFLNNGSPILSRREETLKKRGDFILNYGNLKAQCYFKTEELMDKGEVAIDDEAFPDIDSKNCFIEEMEQIKQRDADKDGKVYIIKKEDIKRNLGRSPDFSDMFMMRMFFELKPKHKIVVSSV